MLGFWSFEQENKSNESEEVGSLTKDQNEGKESAFLSNKR